jgi:hypothetical protein
MIIGLLGDIHGRIRLSLTALLAWQTHTGRPFSLIVQVGDMGAFPHVESMDSATRKYSALDPAEGDFGRLILASGSEAEHFKQVRSALQSPIYFIRGNHEDFGWLSSLPLDSTGTATVDPFGLLRYVPDGAQLEIGSQSIAFLGGVESVQANPSSISPEAHARLLERRPQSTDLLITHDCPWDISRGFNGQIQGSALISMLLDRLQPGFHVAGHYHISIARTYGRTKFLCLNNIVASARWHPEMKGIQPGWIAVIDTSKNSLSHIDSPIITGIQAPSDDWL